MSQYLEFLRYASNKLIIAEIGKGNSSVITCDWVMVLVLCISSHCSLSMCQVSHKSFTQIPSVFSEICSGRANYYKNKGNNSVITCDRATILAFKLYHCIEFHLVPFNTLKEVCAGQAIYCKN